MYISLGCWKEGGNDVRAIPTLEGFDSRLTGSYQKRPRAIELCYDAALDKVGWLSSPSPLDAK